jgi:hypothetical protein
MPYASDDKKREVTLANYKSKYHSDPEFAKKERERQRKLYEKNREKIIARVLKRRAEKSKEGN